MLVADAALMNKINLSVLTEKKINCVIAARVKNTKKDIQEKIFDQTTYAVISSTKENLVLSKEIKSSNGDTLIAYYSSKRARKDAYEREKAINKIKKYLNSTGDNLSPVHFIFSLLIHINQRGYCFAKRSKAFLIFSSTSSVTQK